MSMMHKISSGFRSCSDSAPSTKRNAKDLLLILLTRDDDELYPWQRKFLHDSHPDRSWGPYQTFPDYLANQNPKGPGQAWSGMTVEDYRAWFHDDPEIKRMLGAAMGEEWALRQEEFKEQADSGKTQAEVAEEHGLSQQRVSQITRALPSKPRKGRIDVRLYPCTDTATVAARIRERLGDAYADSLKEDL